jgi:hypothetical protein
MSRSAALSRPALAQVSSPPGEPETSTAPITSSPASIGRYSRSSRLALPFSSFSLSSAHSGNVSVHWVPGGFSANG